MKKFFFLPLFLLSTGVFAQNIQFLYDLGRSEYKPGQKFAWFTTTIENFKPDSLGSTFYFVDLGYQTNQNSMQSAYWEISREFNISKKIPFQLHLEHNGGLYNGGGINTAWLAGVNYPFQLGHSFFNSYVAYKYIVGSTQGPDMQWTGVWNISFWKNRFVFDGFIDVWSTDRIDYTAGTRNGKKVIVLTQPQIWYHLNKNISVGSEIEISKNFIYNLKGMEVYPTIAFKWVL